MKLFNLEQNTNWLLLTDNYLSSEQSVRAPGLNLLAWWHCSFQLPSKVKVAGNIGWKGRPIRNPKHVSQYIGKKSKFLGHIQIQSRMPSKCWLLINMNVVSMFCTPFKAGRTVYIHIGLAYPSLSPPSLLQHTVFPFRPLVSILQFEFIDCLFYPLTHNISLGCPLPPGSHTV